MSAFLDEISHAQKDGEPRGIASICSAHPWVLETVFKHGRIGTTPILIEATCNQVNQFGGYTGRTPSDFRSFINRLAAENEFPFEQVILGGDHLGPSPWQTLPAHVAMQNAVDLVRGFVQAGFTKIHVDTSMHLGGDDCASPLDLELAAARTAALVKVAEETINSDKDGSLRYVIGTEVPLPGGAHTEKAEHSVTSIEQARSTLEAIQAALYKVGLQSAWERTIALVVQPGVEFGSDFIVDYDPEAASELVHFSETTPFVYEAHSTDYQTPASLKNLVRDHFAILKVGPALTFAYREAVFGLARVESEMVPPEQCSHLLEVIESTMLQEPEHWQNHYRGSSLECSLARKYSLSDRIRYYWGKPAIQSALVQLLHNFGERPLPLSLISQYFHSLYAPIREGRMRNSANSLMAESIALVLQDYSAACNPTHAQMTM